jgi:hypothetical protein
MDMIRSSPLWESARESHPQGLGINRCYCVRVYDRPGSSGGIQLQGRAYVRQPSRDAMRRDTPQRNWIEVGGLPEQRRQGGCEVDGVLAGAAGDLQHGPVFRQYTREDGEDGIPIARE